jgi:3-oxoacyl-[acyl-carrier-protein] synthase II
MPPNLSTLLRDHPIVVTGTGVVSAAGVSTGGLWQSAHDGRVFADWCDFAFGGKILRRAVCTVPPIDTLLAPFPRARKMDRAVQFALVAAGQAWKEAGLANAGLSPERVGVVVGTSRGPVEKRNLSGDSLHPARILPSFAANGTIGSFNGTLSQSFALHGPSFTVSASCSSAAAAIALGAQQILLGLADIMLVGGADAALHPLLIAQLDAAGILGQHENPTKTCRPFDAARNGLCLGEGAAFLVLESAHSAQKRAAKSLGTMAGWATGVENAGRTGVGQGGAMLAHTINRALQTAHLSPGDIDYLNAHGTGTIVNDAAEAAAIQKVFSDTGTPPPCSSTKPITGHCLGATPAMEAILCLQALQHQTIPPTANCENQDRACAIDAVPLQARAANLRHVMSTSLGFWGSHAVLIFSGHA